MDIDGVFEGGGIRAIALAGAAVAAMDAGYPFRRAAGTSAGAMVASLVAAGYDSSYPPPRILLGPLSCLGGTYGLSPAYGRSVPGHTVIPLR